MTELTNEQLMQASQEDHEIYMNAVANLANREGFKGSYLDKYGVEIPYGSQSHILKHFRQAFDIVKPKNVLEIGFNLGHGAAMMLAISDINLTSVDISDKDETLASADELKKQYGNRFRFVLSDSGVAFNLLKDQKYDLIFIDGGHNEPEVTNDIQLASQLDIPYLLFDDIYPRFGPGVQSSIAKLNLEIVADMNNLWLMKWK